jgi:hypothetical protein
MKPSNAKKKSKKKKRPSPPATEGAPPPPPAGSPRSPLSETLTLAAAAAAASEAESAGSSSGGDVSAYSRSFTPSSSSSGAASTSSFYAPSSSSSSSAAGDERRDLAWLLDAFASATIDQVEAAYRDAGADPFLAAGILGSTYQPPPPPPPDLSPHAGSAGRKPARRPRKLPVAASGMVADVIGKGYSRPATPPVSVPSGRKGAASNGWNDVRNGCGPAADPACNVEEAEQFLCSMLGDSSELNMGVVRDVLGESSFNTCC